MSVPKPVHHEPARSVEQGVGHSIKVTILITCGMRLEDRSVVAQKTELQVSA